MKYRLTGETRMYRPRHWRHEQRAVTLHRIVAAEYNRKYKIKTGTLGGWIENPSNLSQLGKCWIGKNAIVYGNATVSGNALVTGQSRVCGTAQITEDATASDATVVGNTFVGGHCHVCGDVLVAEHYF